MAYQPPPTPVTLDQPGRRRLVDLVRQLGAMIEHDDATRATIDTSATAADTTITLSVTVPLQRDGDES